MKIGKLNFKHNLFLAPMAGVTDFAFRSLAREMGADFSYTEMVSAKGLVFNQLKTNKKLLDKNLNTCFNCDNSNDLCKNNDILDNCQNFSLLNSCFDEENSSLEKNLTEYEKMLYTSKLENPVAVQIFGSDAKFMEKAVKLPQLQKFDIIDINMGCPAPKIVKNGDGSALLKDLKKAVDVANAVVKSTTKPVTVKMRLGFGINENVSVELGRMLQDVGVSAVCVHGRTREQFYSGKVNLEAIATLKSKLNIPVIGNGDVFDDASYFDMLKTGVDAVMVGRGALGKPWIFNQLLHFKKLCENKNNENKQLNTHYDELDNILNNKNLDKQKDDVCYDNSNLINKIDITSSFKKEIIKKHISMLQKVYSEKFIVTHMRKHLLWYVKEMPDATKYRLQLCKINSVNEALILLDQIFI